MRPIDSVSDGLAQRFNPSSRPSVQRAQYPAMADVRDVFCAVYSDLCVAVEESDAVNLAEANPCAPVQIAFPAA